MEYVKAEAEVKSLHVGELQEDWVLVEHGHSRPSLQPSF